MARPLVSEQTRQRLRIIRESAMEHTADIYRSPEQAGGKIGAPVLALEGVAVGLRALSEEGRLQSALVELAGTRAQIIGVFPYGTVLQAGDEVRLDDGRVLCVEGIGKDWSTAVPVALSEVRP